jgi:hypothetical protein
MTAIINGDSPSITFSDATTQATSAVVSGKVPKTLMPTGSVLQVVTTTSALNASTSSTTFVTTGLSAAITPTSSTSKILIMVSACVGQANYQGDCRYTVFRGTVAGTNLAVGTNSCMALTYTAINYPAYCNVGINYVDSPATTSSTTYTIGFLTSSGADTAYFGNNGSSTITLMEISA